MNFISLDIRVGLAGVTHIQQDDHKFHREVCSLAQPQIQDLVRLGLPNCSPISHRQMVHDPRCISGIVLSALQESNGSNNIDICIIDFTSNLFVEVREPLLLALADAFAQAFDNHLCRFFIVLLPELPGPQAASLNRLEGLTANSSVASPTIMLLSNSGVTRSFGANAAEIPTAIPRYTELLAKRFGSPEVRLERKCIRRLGHFRTIDPPGRNGKCRLHSFFIHDCDKDMLALLSTWWQSHAQSTRVVLFDLRHNPAFRDAVKALTDQRGIVAERIVDSLSNRQLGNLIASMGPCTLILDVVEHGEVLRHYIQQLAGRGISVNKKVLAAISKAGATDIIFRDYHVHSFLKRPRDPEDPQCIQCSLSLPFTSEVAEPLGQIRSYDILQMANTYGWEAEPPQEIPKNIGLGYNMIPAFAQILFNYGDWLGYKLYDQLRSGLSPADWFLILPREGDSWSLAERLLACMEEPPCVIQVPRSAIEYAQLAKNEWHRIIPQYKHEFWAQQLSSVGSSSALILDIFNGSGSTAITLHQLLHHYHIEAFCYACLINFQPRMSTIPGTGVPIYSLYDWFNPRELLGQEAPTK